MLARSLSRASWASRSPIRPFSSVFHEDPRWPGWEPVIGIEVHTQIHARRKLFSHTSIDVTAEPNTHVSLFDAAFPGTLPVLNQTCVDLATRTAIALGATVQERSSFDRKHYFYPDLPSGYQITQYYSPLATGGSLYINTTDKPENPSGKVRIKQVQLEQDTAKSTASPDSVETLIDINRAGAALMEIVSEPDMRSPEEAGAYVRRLQALLRAVGASNGNMEEGSLRCDVNVSIHRPGEPFGTRCEIKNMNSIRSLMIAINSEIRRHISCNLSGEVVRQETRGFDDERAETYLLRSKEDAPDYRYMPDPNLPLLIISQEYIEKIRSSMPELPDATRTRLSSTLGLPPRDVDVLMAMQAAADVPFNGEPGGGGAISYFEEIARSRNPRVVANWITNELLGQLAYREVQFTTTLLPPGLLGELIDRVEDGTLTTTSGKMLLRHLLEAPSSEPLSDRIDRLSLRSTGTSGLRESCEAAIAALPKEAALAKAGNPKLVMRLVGEVMRQTGGRADARAAAQMLKELLGL